MSKQSNITGETFGILTAIKSVRKDKHYNYSWLFKCICGKLKIISKSAVVNGHTKSCGCFLKSEEMKKIRTRPKTHGMRYTRTYSSWKSMLDRIRNKNYGKYYNNLPIAKRWYTFINFYKDMGDRPLGMTLDRIDNSKGYFPSNCRWATYKEQSRNRSTVIVYKGETAKDGSLRLGGSHVLISKRLQRGWSIKDAFLIPPDRTFRYDLSTVTVLLSNVR
jgi:hypothetical protein